MTALPEQDLDRKAFAVCIVRNFEKLGRNTFSNLGVHSRLRYHFCGSHSAEGARRIQRSLDGRDLVD